MTHIPKHTQPRGPGTLALCPPDFLLLPGASSHGSLPPNTKAIIATKTLSPKRDNNLRSPFEEYCQASLNFTTIQNRFQSRCPDFPKPACNTKPFKGDIARTQNAPTPKRVAPNTKQWQLHEHLSLGELREGRGPIYEVCRLKGGKQTF